MWTKATIIVGCLCAASLVRANDPLPDWLPPPPNPQPFWDLSKPVQTTLPSDDFVNVLTNVFTIQTNDDPLFVNGRLKLTREAAIDKGVWSSNVETPSLQALRETPALSRDWTSGQSLQMPLPIQKSLFMFGQFDTSSDVDYTQKKLTGRTGVGWKWLPFSGSELQVRSGTLMKYEEDYQARISQSSQLSVELQAKVALLGSLQLQYAGEALPALAQSDRNTLLQDLKFALPLGTNREFNLGAKYRWDDSLTPTPWQQRAELYLGFKFQR